MRKLIFILLAVMCTWAPMIYAAPQKICRSNWCYYFESFNGWKVFYSDDLYELGGELFKVSSEQLKSDLEYIKQVISWSRVERLQRTEVYLSLSDPTGYASFGVYHHSRDELIKRGDDPEKAGHIEIANASNYLKWRISQPGAVLHELSHAYRKNYLSKEEKSLLKDIYKRAVESGVYESVSYFNGKKTFNKKSYAIKDRSEYFCESVEAYFWKNDYYPFNRAQLFRHDPEMADFIERVWVR